MKKKKQIYYLTPKERELQKYLTYLEMINYLKRNSKLK